MKSYFFIPGNHPKLREKLKTIDADALIIDIEDSINQDEYSDVLELISKIDNKQNLIVRPRLFGGLIPTDIVFNVLLRSGFREFVIPKFRTLNDLNLLAKILESMNINDAKFILLIENPESLFSIKNILEETKLNIIGLGFGSHDFCIETGMNHDNDVLKMPRFMISGIAKAYGKIAIDIACMNIKDEEIFIKEVGDAMDLGFDAKFTIHPKQLELLRKYRAFTRTQIFEAEEIILKHIELGKPAVFVFKGRTIEPPHIKKYQRIINWKSKYGSK